MARGHPDRTVRPAALARLRLARTPGQRPGRPARSTAGAAPIPSAPPEHGRVSGSDPQSLCDGCREWDKAIAGVCPLAVLEPMRTRPVTTSVATVTPCSTRDSKFFTAIGDLR